MQDSINFKSDFLPVSDSSSMLVRSQRRARSLKRGCAERSEGHRRGGAKREPDRRSLDRRPVKALGRTEHPGVPAFIELPRHLRLASNASVATNTTKDFQDMSPSLTVYGPYKEGQNSRDAGWAIRHRALCCIGEQHGVLRLET